MEGADGSACSYRVSCRCCVLMAGWSLIPYGCAEAVGIVIAMALGCLLGIGVAKRDEEGLRIWPKSKAGTPKRR